MGDPILVDESLEQLDPLTIQPGDVVGISVHTGNALRGYEVGHIARERGATVVYGGIHATLFPEEPFTHGAAHAVVKGDGDVAWGQCLRELAAGVAQRIYEGGKLEGNDFLAARWDLMDKSKYMPRMYNDQDLDTMQLVRCAFDPDTISNPGKVFPTPRLCGEVPGRKKGAHPLQEAGLAEVF